MPIFEEIIFSLSVALKKKRYLCSSRREKSSALKKAFFALSGISKSPISEEG